MVSGVDLFSQDVDSFVTSENVANGFLARPKAPGIYPGIVMMHEWWGLNNNIKMMAKILAKKGYAVYAVDLFNGAIANSSERAMELVTKVSGDEPAAIKIMEDAANYLRQKEHVTKLASIGWCFGGGQSLQLSLHHSMDATVIYYGMLTNDENQLKKLKGPLLGIFGSADTAVTEASVKGFQESLIKLKKPNQIIIYPGLGHAFANPTGPNYAQQQTVNAWEKTVDFLDKQLKRA